MPNVSWEDIGGLENVKRELQEVIEFTTWIVHSSLLHLSHLALLLTVSILVLFCIADCSVSC